MAASRTSVAFVFSVPTSLTRAKSPGVSARERLEKTARVRIVPLRGSTWLSTKSRRPSCGKAGLVREPEVDRQPGRPPVGAARAPRPAGVAQIGLLVAVEVEIHGVDRDDGGEHRAGGRPRLDQVAGGHQRVTHPPRNRRADPGPLQVEPGGLDRGLGGADRGAPPWASALVRLSNSSREIACSIHQLAGALHFALGQ